MLENIKSTTHCYNKPFLKKNFLVWFFVFFIIHFNVLKCYSVLSVVIFEIKIIIYLLSLYPYYSYCLYIIDIYLLHIFLVFDWTDGAFPLPHYSKTNLQNYTRYIISMCNQMFWTPYKCFCSVSKRFINYCYLHILRILIRTQILFFMAESYYIH